VEKDKTDAGSRERNDTASATGRTADKSRVTAA
jgi:hypothetical protein